MDLSKMEEGRATMLAMPKIFDDGCVLQSGQDVPVWGWCEPWPERYCYGSGTCVNKEIQQ